MKEVFVIVIRAFNDTDQKIASKKKQKQIFMNTVTEVASSQDGSDDTDGFKLLLTKILKFEPLAGYLNTMDFDLDTQKHLNQNMQPILDQLFVLAGSDKGRLEELQLQCKFLRASGASDWMEKVDAKVYTLNQEPEAVDPKDLQTVEDLQEYYNKHREDADDTNALKALDLLLDKVDFPEGFPKVYSSVFVQAHKSRVAQKFLESEPNLVLLNQLSKDHYSFVYDRTVYDYWANKIEDLLSQKGTEDFVGFSRIVQLAPKNTVIETKVFEKWDMYTSDQCAKAVTQEEKLAVVQGARHGSKVYARAVRSLAGCFPKDELAGTETL